MSAQALHDGAHILLAAGIVLLILTVILAVKFEIFRMLITELSHNKKGAAPESGVSQPVSVTQPPVKENNAAEVRDEIRAEEKAEPPRESIPKAKAVEHSATMVVSSNKSIPDPEGTVVISNKKTNDVPKDDYVIIENIIVIHGDPDITSL